MDTAAGRGRILVVEDDPVSAAYVLHVLRNRGGFTVTHAADPQDALRQATAARWDLVLPAVPVHRGVWPAAVRHHVRRLPEGTPHADARREKTEKTGKAVSPV